jgi:hypothetical protein
VVVAACSDSPTAPEVLYDAGSAAATTVPAGKSVRLPRATNPSVTLSCVMAKTTDDCNHLANSQERLHIDSGPNRGDPKTTGRLEYYWYVMYDSDGNNTYESYCADMEYGSKQLCGDMKNVPRGDDTLRVATQAGSGFFAYKGGRILCWRAPNTGTLG